MRTRKRISQTYNYKISQFYKNKGYKKFINASVPGHLPSFQLCWFLKEGYKYKPDVIIQTLTSKLDLYISENDDGSLCENICSREFVDSNGYLTSKANYTLSYFKKKFKNSSLIFYSWLAISKTRSLFVKDKQIIKILKKMLDVDPNQRVKGGYGRLKSNAFF